MNNRRREFRSRIRPLVFLLIALPAAGSFRAARDVPRGKLTIACVNFHPAWGNKSENLQRILTVIRDAAGRGAEVVLFPELALTGYQIDPDRSMHHELAETVPGPSTLKIARLTRKLGVYAVLGLPERRIIDSRPVIFNSAAVVGPGGVIGAYAKLMPFGNEMTWCEKGSAPFLFDSPWGPVGVGICYDSYMFPELPRYYAALGARLYLHMTALGAFPGWDEYYLNQMRARSIENMLCVASANLMGKDLTAEFPGASLVVTPGDVAHQVKVFGGPAADGQPEILLAEVDLGAADRMRERYPLFHPNRFSGAPDWRLPLYLRMLQTIDSSGRSREKGTAKDPQARNRGNVEMP